MKKGIGFYSIQTIRILVGVLFIFSGLIKANDPSGLAYKMQEYFEVWGWTFFSSWALTFSVLMIIFEIVAGVALLIGYYFRLFSFLLLLLMILFLYLTGYAVFSGKIKECGCFGDCIPLQAMQSFIKDVILLVLVIILFAARNKIKPLFKNSVGAIIIALSFLASWGIQWYVLKHLPYYDCLPYKEGNNLWGKMQVPDDAEEDVYETTYLMKNEVSGETKTITDKEYLESGIWKDTTWIIDGDPIQKLIKKGNNTPAIQDFNIMDYEGNDYTEYILKEPGYNFLFFLKDTKVANTKNLDKLKNIFTEAEKNNVGFYILSADSKEATEQFLKANQLNATVYTIDGTACKTAMRSNPGLMLIKNGTVKGKWSYMDYPGGFKWINGNQEIEVTP